MIALSYQRIAQLADQRVAEMPREGTWGVWDLHTKEWVSSGWFYERDAFQARIDVASLHPWELRLARADEDGQPLFGDVDYDDESCPHDCPDCAEDDG